MDNKKDLEMICRDVHFKSITDDRFKSARISFNMTLPLEKETASLNAILPMVLRRSSKKYSTFKSINRVLSELYGAGVYADIKKIGEAQVISLSASYSDDKFLPEDEDISVKIATLLCELIFSPNVTDESFNSVDVEQEKRQLFETLQAELNDKRAYAKRRCEEIMCEGEKFSINALGDEESIEKIDGRILYKHWLYVLSNAKIDIIMIGGAEQNRVKEQFRKAFSKIERQASPKISTEIIPTAKEVKEVSDKIDVKQAKLVLGFRTNSSVNDSDVMATRLMVALFGGTPHSKLFMVVREKMSLCYYCSSIFHRNKGIMLVQSGVENKNIEKTRVAVLEQLEEIKKGNFNDNEIEATKLSMVNSFNSLTDSVGGLESWYISQLFEPEFKSVEDCIKEVKKINKQAIINVANKVSLDTVYVLSSGEEAKDNEQDI